MSRKVLIQMQQPNPPTGPVFGRASDPVEFMNSQIYAHEHVEGVVKDLLVQGAASALVQSGFDASLTAGLSLSVAAGRAVSVDGHSYDTIPVGQATALTMAPADPTLPRIDLVYALLETDANANSQFKPFVQLRTQAQLEQVPPVPPYPPTQLNVPTEQHTRATVLVRTGTPNANPVAPSAGANEVPLFQVRINAGAVSLINADVTDVRNKARSLFSAWASIDTINANPILQNFNEAVDDRVAAFLSVAPNTGLSETYNDPGNSLTLAGVAATTVVMGMMSAADKTKLDAATSTNTASALVARDANGDFAARDITAARKVKYPDGSEQVQSVRRETPITLFDSVNGFVTTSNVYAYVLRQGIAFYVNLWAEDFIGATLCLETVGVLNGGFSTMEVQPYNVTDNVLLDVTGNIHEWTHGVQQVRGAAFSLSGTGRKRIQIRFRVTNNTDTGTLYAARLIINPSYTACGSFSGSCPV
jgi:hypothetical protein